MSLPVVFRELASDDVHDIQRTSRASRLSCVHSCKTASTTGVAFALPDDAPHNRPGMHVQTAALTPIAKGAAFPKPSVVIPRLEEVDAIMTNKIDHPMFLS